MVKMESVKHVLGISGGKDSAALALYMRRKFPDLDVEYYTCDTGKELQETYELIEKLNSVLGKSIVEYKSVDSLRSSENNAFDHFLATYGSYLPSTMTRWCTKKMKLEPFERTIGNSPTISYVGIRGDEDREGYISTKENIQSIFPFRRNIWSEDVIQKVLSNSNISVIREILLSNFSNESSFQRFCEIVEKVISLAYTTRHKLNQLLDLDTVLFNKIVFLFLKSTSYPVGMLDDFPLIYKDESLGINDIFNILEESGVGIPAYYKPLEYEIEINGEIKKGTYSRSRSGCFFCFYQQKIEWVWLLENHPDLFIQAMEYEKSGYSWSEERLEDLSKPERVEKIKREHYLRTNRVKGGLEVDWKDQIMDAEGTGCSSCFI